MFACGGCKCGVPVVVKCTLELVTSFCGSDKLVPGLYWKSERSFAHSRHERAFLEMHWLDIRRRRTVVVELLYRSFMNYALLISNSSSSFLSHS